MPTTPSRALRFPLATDPDDVPGDLERLALDTERELDEDKAAASAAYVAKATQTFTRLRRTTLQSIPNGTAAAIAWDAEDVDENVIFDPATPTRVTIAAAGRYRITAGVQFASNATGDRRLDFLLSGGVLLAIDARRASGASITSTSISDEVLLSAGDFVEVRATQTSGGALDIGTPGHSSTFFSIARIT
jgi:hypothetical protein